MRKDQVSAYPSGCTKVHFKSLFSPLRSCPLPLSFVDNFFPVRGIASYLHQSVEPTSRAVSASFGFTDLSSPSGPNSIETELNILSNDLLRIREDLHRTIELLPLPANFLDLLVDQLGGPSAVAEMTGRKGRVVRNHAGRLSYEMRAKPETSDMDSLNGEEWGSPQFKLGINKITLS